MLQALAYCDANVSRKSKAVEGDTDVKHIGVVLYEGFSLVGVGTLIETLNIANELQASRNRRGLIYSVSLLSACGGVVTCSSSVRVHTEALDAPLSHVFHALYVAGGSGVGSALADHGLVDALKAARFESTGVSALGSGHALLTAAGLSCETCVSQGRYLLMHSDTTCPRDERSHALIYALGLLRRDLGHDIASSAAERLLDRQHVSIVLSEIGTPTAAEKTQQSARWLERNCEKPVSIDDAAHSAAMSGRNFSRHFKREMGVTPSQYLLNARLKLSCELLTSSELPIDKIARRTGLSNEERLSKLFRKQFSMSPAEYRARNQAGSLS